MLLNRDLIQILRDGRGFADTRVVRPAPDTHVFLRPLLPAKTAVVALFNGGDSAVTMRFEFAQVPRQGWLGNTTLQLVDVWTKEAHDNVTGGWAARVGPHEIVVVTLSVD